MFALPDEAVAIVKAFEGCSLELYRCPGGWPTIGYGHVVRPGEGLASITQAEADTLLARDLAKASHWLLKLTYVPLTDFQFGALVSFVFNVGSGNYQRSTLRMLINREEFDDAAEEFWKWRRSSGRILRGLVLRREAERLLFEA